MASFVLNFKGKKLLLLKKEDNYTDDTFESMRVCNKELEQV